MIRNNYGKIAEKTLPILVSRYAKKFGVDVRIQGSTAYTNGKTITIPRLDLNDPDKVVCACAYLAHESAHIRYTDFGVVGNAGKGKPFLFFSLFNIIEDARVEYLISRHFIGVWENLRTLHNHNEKKDFIRAVNRGEVSQLQVFCAFLQEYLAQTCQRFDLPTDCGDFFRKNMVEVFGENLIADIEKLAENVREFPDTEKSYKTTIKIFQLLKKSVACKKLKDKLVENQEKSEGLDRTEGEGDRQGELNDFDIALKNFDKITGEDLDKVCPGNSPADIIQNMSNSKCTSSREDYGSLCIPNAEKGEDLRKECGNYYKLSEILRQKVKAWHEFKREYSSSSGRYLNIFKAQNIPLGESNVFYKKGAEVDYSTAVHICVDVSASMLTDDGYKHSRAKVACMSALALSMGLDNLEDVKTAVTCFPGITSECAIVKRFDDPLKKRILYYDQRPRSSTPLAQALSYAVNQFESANCNRNIILVLTDGMPDSVSNCKKMFDVIKKLGIELYAISINSEMAFKLFDKAQMITNLGELPKACIKLISNLFEIKKQERRVNS